MPQDSLARVTREVVACERVPAAARVVPQGRAREGAALPRAGVLGPRGAGFRRPAGPPADRGPRPRRPRGEPHGPRLHGRPLGRLPLRGPSPGRASRASPRPSPGTTACACGTPTSPPSCAARLRRTSPLPRRPARCRGYLVRELRLLPQLRAILALGKIAMDGIVSVLREEGRAPARKALAFGHGVRHPLGDGLVLFASYHPSQQNTFTGRLTPASFDRVLRDVRAHLGAADEAGIVPRGPDPSRRARPAGPSRPGRGPRPHLSLAEPGPGGALCRRPARLVRERGEALSRGLRPPRPLRRPRLLGAARPLRHPGRDARAAGAVRVPGGGGGRRQLVLRERPPGRARGPGRARRGRARGRDLPHASRAEPTGPCSGCPWAAMPPCASRCRIPTGSWPWPPTARCSWRRLPGGRRGRSRADGRLPRGLRQPHRREPCGRPPIPWPWPRRRTGGDLPALSFDCGAEDRYGLAAGNRRLHESPAAEGAFPMPSSCLPGDHGYEYVRSRLETSLRFLDRDLTGRRGWVTTPRGGTDPYGHESWDGLEETWLGRSRGKRAREEARRKGMPNGCHSGSGRCQVRPFMRRA